MKIGGRKLLVFLLLFAAFGGMAFLQVLKGLDPSGSQQMMFFSGVAYIGGNVFNTFVKSKWFQPALAEGKKNE